MPPMKEKLLKNSSRCSCHKCDSLRCFGKRYRKGDKSSGCSKCLFINNDPKINLAKGMQKFCTESDLAFSFYPSRNTARYFRHESKNKKEMKSTMQQKLNDKSSSDINILIKRNNLVLSKNNNGFGKFNIRKRRTGEIPPKIGKEFVKKLGAAVKEKYNKEKVFEKLLEYTSHIEKPSHIPHLKKYNILLKSQLIDNNKPCSCRVCECTDDITSVPNTGLVQSDLNKLLKKQFYTKQFETNVKEDRTSIKNKHYDVKKRKIFQQETLKKQHQRCPCCELSQNMAARGEDIKGMVIGCENVESQIITFIIVPKKAIRWNISKDKKETFGDPTQNRYKDHFPRSCVKPIINRNYSLTYESKDVIQIDKPLDRKLKGIKQDSKKIYTMEISKNYESKFNVPNKDYSEDSNNTQNTNKLISEVVDMSNKLYIVEQNVDKAIKTMDAVTGNQQTSIQEIMPIGQKDILERKAHMFTKSVFKSDTVNDSKHINPQAKYSNVITTSTNNMTKGWRKNQQKEKNREMVKAIFGDEIHRRNNKELKGESYKQKKRVENAKKLYKRSHQTLNYDTSTTNALAKNKELAEIKTILTNIQRLTNAKKKKTITKVTSTTDMPKRDSQLHYLRKRISALNRILDLKLNKHQKSQTLTKLKKQNSQTLITNISDTDVLESDRRKLPKDLRKCVLNLKRILINKQRLNNENESKYRITEQTVTNNISNTDKHRQWIEDICKQTLNFEKIPFEKIKQDSMTQSSQNSLHHSKSVVLELEASDKDHYKIVCANLVPNTDIVNNIVNEKSQVIYSRQDGHKVVEKKRINQHKKLNKGIIQAIITDEINNRLMAKLNELELINRLYVFNKHVDYDKKIKEKNRTTVTKESITTGVIDRDTELIKKFGEQILNLKRISMYNKRLNCMSHPSLNSLLESKLVEHHLGSDKDHYKNIITNSVLKYNAMNDSGNIESLVLRKRDTLQPQSNKKLTEERKKYSLASFTNEINNCLMKKLSEIEFKNRLCNYKTVQKLKLQDCKTLTKDTTTSDIMKKYSEMTEDFSVQLLSLERGLRSKQKQNNTIKLRQKTQNVSKNASITNIVEKDNKSPEDLSKNKMNVEKFSFNEQRTNFISHPSLHTLYVSKSVELEFTVSEKDHITVMGTNSVSHTDTVNEREDMKFETMIKSEVLTPDSNNLMNENRNDQLKEIKRNIIQMFFTKEINDQLMREINEIEAKEKLHTLNKLTENEKKLEKQKYPSERKSLLEKNSISEKRKTNVTDSRKYLQQSQTVSSDTNITLEQDSEFLQDLSKIVTSLQKNLKDRQRKSNAMKFNKCQENIQTTTDITNTTDVLETKGNFDEDVSKKILSLEKNLIKKQRNSNAMFLKKNLGKSKTDTNDTNISDAIERESELPDELFEIIKSLEKKLENKRRKNNAMKFKKHLEKSQIVTNKANDNNMQEKYSELPKDLSKKQKFNSSTNFKKLQRCGHTVTNDNNTSEVLEISSELDEDLRKRMFLLKKYLVYKQRFNNAKDLKKRKQHRQIVTKDKKLTDAYERDSYWPEDLSKWTELLKKKLIYKQRKNNAMKEQGETVTSELPDLRKISFSLEKNLIKKQRKTNNTDSAKYLDKSLCVTHDKNTTNEQERDGELPVDLNKETTSLEKRLINKQRKTNNTDLKNNLEKSQTVTNNTKTTDVLEQGSELPEDLSITIKSLEKILINKQRKNNATDSKKYQDKSQIVSKDTKTTNVQERGSHMPVDLSERILSLEKILIKKQRNVTVTNGANTTDELERDSVLAKDISKRILLLDKTLVEKQRKTNNTVLKKHLASSLTVINDMNTTDVLERDSELPEDLSRRIMLLHNFLIQKQRMNKATDLKKLLERSQIVINDINTTEKLEKDAEMPVDFSKGILSLEFFLANKQRNVDLKKHPEKRQIVINDTKTTEKLEKDSELTEDFSKRIMSLQNFLIKKQTMNNATDLKKYLERSQTVVNHINTTEKLERDTEIPADHSKGMVSLEKSLVNKQRNIDLRKHLEKSQTVTNDTNTIEVLGRDSELPEDLSKRIVSLQNLLIKKQRKNNRTDLKKHLKKNQIASNDTNTTEKLEKDIEVLVDLSKEILSLEIKLVNKQRNVDLRTHLEKSQTVNNDTNTTKVLEKDCGLLEDLGKRIIALEKSLMNKQKKTKNTKE